MYVRVSMCMHACERESVLNVLFFFLSLIAQCTVLAYLCIKLFIQVLYTYLLGQTDQVSIKVVICGKYKNLNKIINI